MIRKTGQWGKALRVLKTAPRRLRAAITDAPRGEADYYRELIRKNLEDGGRTGGQPFRPLSAATLEMRRAAGLASTDPLKATGELYASITARRGSRGWFVGVPGDRRRGRLTLAAIAAIHENGAGPYMIRTTPAMRRLLGARLGGSGGAYILVRIPARPFIAPVFRRHGSRFKTERRVMRAVGRALGGDLGTVR